MPLEPITKSVHDDLNRLTAWVEDVQRRGFRILALRVPERLRDAWGNHGRGGYYLRDIPVRFTEETS